MNYFTMIENEGLVISGTNFVNAIALPSIKNMKYLINFEDKKVFFAGLNMLSSRSFKARLAKIALIAIYHLGLTKYLLKVNLVTINKNSLLLANIKKNYNKCLGVNFYIGGAKSQNFSITVQVINPDKEYYLRYPISCSSKQFASNEFKNLNHLYQKGISASVQQFDKIIQVNGSNLYSYEGIDNYITTTNLCINKIKLLRDLTFTDYEFLTNNAFFQDSNRLIKEALINSKNDLYLDIIKIYEETVESMASLSIKKAFFHGDFSPDNILISSNQFYLIDFEYSCTDFFSCFDLFHYLFKANKFHIKTISLKDIKIIDDYVKEIYQGYPFSNKYEINTQEIIRSLYILYLFLMLKRYIVDEKIDPQNYVISNLQKNIRILFTDEKN